MSISITSEYLFSIAGFGVTNGMLTACVISAVLIAFSVFISKRLTIVPGRLQVGIEFIFEYMFGQIKQAFGSKESAEKFFPLFFTLLIFILVANQFSLIPFVSQLVFAGDPLFRLPTADLSATVALALLILLIAHFIALSVRPLKHIGGFVKLGALARVRSIKEIPMALLDFLLGLLDIVSEFAKLLSLSFRLFGNIFAGEVMVAVIAGISAYTSYIVPIPFIVLSIFSGLVQAFVFVLLSMQYISATIRGIEKK